jgi:hypothetical protein
VRCCTQSRPSLRRRPHVRWLRGAVRCAASTRPDDDVLSRGSVLIDAPRMGRSDVAPASGRALQNSVISDSRIGFLLLCRRRVAWRAGRRRPRRHRQPSAVGRHSPARSARSTRSTAAALWSHRTCGAAARVRRSPVRSASTHTHTPTTSSPSPTASAPAPQPSSGTRWAGSSPSPAPPTPNRLCLAPEARGGRRTLLPRGAAPAPRRLGGGGREGATLPTQTRGARQGGGGITS